VQAHGAHVVVRQGLHSVQHLQVNVASAVLGNPSIAKTAATAPAAARCSNDLLLTASFAFSTRSSTDITSPPMRMITSQPSWP
jgi:hypothetical protein